MNSSNESSSPAPVKFLHLIDRSEVSLALKYLIFIFNIIVWLIGLGLLAVGVWAAQQKNISAITATFIDPVRLLIIIGAIVFVVGFFGCVGALRENIILLVLYAVIVGAILLLVIAAAVILFICRDWVKRSLRAPLELTIEQYRDDPDLQNLIDWVQADWLQCCGVDNYRDWDRNIYFNCSQQNIDHSVEACAVPFSCCRPDPTWPFKNMQCGYGVLQQNELDIGNVIYTKGCLEQGDAWFQQYMIPVAGAVVALGVILILGMCCAANLAADVRRQKSKWKRFPN